MPLSQQRQSRGLVNNLGIGSYQSLHACIFTSTIYLFIYFSMHYLHLLSLILQIYSQNTLVFIKVFDLISSLSTSITSTWFCIRDATKKVSCDTVCLIPQRVVAHYWAMVYLELDHVNGRLAHTCMYMQLNLLKSSYAYMCVYTYPRLMQLHSPLTPSWATKPQRVGTTTLENEVLGAELVGSSAFLNQYEMQKFYFLEWSQSFYLAWHYRKLKQGSPDSTTHYSCIELGLPFNIIFTRQSRIREEITDIH